jgi:PAS domain S-box-containing protein
MKEKGFVNKSASMFLLSIVAIGTTLLLEYTFPIYLYSSIVCLLIVFYALSFPGENTYLLWIGYLSTLCIILLYSLSLKNLSQSPTTAAHHIASILLLWITVYGAKQHAKNFSKSAQRQQLLKAIFDNAAEGIVVCTEDGSIALSNSSIGRMFGYQENELNQSNLSELIPARLQSLHIEHVKRFMRKPIGRAMGNDKEFVGLHKQGHEFPVSIGIKHFYIADKVYAIAFVLDLTEKRKTENELLKEQQLSKTYLELAPIMFVALDKAGVVKSINNFGSQMLGYPKSDILGKNWFDHYLPDNSKEEIKQYFSKIINGATADLTYENKIICYKDSVCDISWRNTLVDDGRTNDVTVLAAGIDITERRKQERLLKSNHEYVTRLNDHLEDRVKARTQELLDTLDKYSALNHQLQNEVEGRRKAQGELVRSQRLYKLIAQHFPEGVIGVMKKDMRYIFADGQELKDIGLSEGNNIGRRLFDSNNPEAVEEAEASLGQVFAGKTVSFDIRLRNRVYNVTSTPLTQSEHGVDEALVVIRNVTKQKKLEHRLVKTIEKEKQLNQMKSRFVTMASHEFRTPLSVILSSAFLLESYNGKSFELNKGTYLGKIRRSVNTLTELMNDFVSLGKLEEGKIKVHYFPINLSEFIREAVQEVELIKKNGQLIVYHHTGQLPILFTDKQLIKGILANLLGNAIKYSAEGTTITLTSSINEKVFKIQVEDQGIGIPLEEQSQIFKRFYRAQNATNIEGTGIGLNIVRKYVRLLKGTIEFKSKPGHGSIFYVTIPLINHEPIINKE